MRFKYDPDKNRQLKNNPKRGIGLAEAREIWTHPYYEDFRKDDPEQFRVIGWVQGMLYSLIYEVRHDDEGEYFYLMSKTAKKLSAEEIAELADQGKDVSKYFTNTGKMKLPTQRVNVDFTLEMLGELDQLAGELNVSRQAVIKTYLRDALDRHYMAKEKV